jgi:hypothetical protein
MMPRALPWARGRINKSRVRGKGKATFDTTNESSLAPCVYTRTSAVVAKHAFLTCNSFAFPAMAKSDMGYGQRRATNGNLAQPFLPECTVLYCHRVSCGHGERACGVHMRLFLRNVPDTCCIKRESRDTDVRRSAGQNTLSYYARIQQRP